MAFPLIFLVSYFKLVTVFLEISRSIDVYNTFAFTFVFALLQNIYLNIN